MRKRILAIVLMVVMIATTVLVTVGCTEATQVSYNVSQEADNFNVIRRLTVINTRTDKPSFELVAAFHYRSIMTITKLRLSAKRARVNTKSIS